MLGLVLPECPLAENSNCSRFIGFEASRLGVSCITHAKCPCLMPGDSQIHTQRLPLDLAATGSSQAWHPRRSLEELQTLRDRQSLEMVVWMGIQCLHCRAAAAQRRPAMRESNDKV